MPQLQLFRSSDDYHHHYRLFSANADRPKGYVVALHGIQSHSGWYDYSSQRLADAGYDVRFLDRRGSGLNGKDRGHAPHYVRLINDVRQFLQRVQLERDRIAPGAPIILQAVSWGGKVAAAVAARDPQLLDGLALLYPGLCAKIGPSWRQRRLLNLGMACGKQQQRVPIPLSDSKLFTGEARWQKFIDDDFRTVHNVSIGFLKASLDLEKYIHQQAAEIRTPLLLMLAGEDQIIDNDATEKLLLRFGSPRKTVLKYEQARHTLEFEPNRDEIFTDLVGWLDQLPRPREEQQVAGQIDKSEPAQTKRLAAM